MRETVREAYRRGWSVIPVGLDKKPLIPTWKPYQVHTPAPDDIKGWLKLKPAGWAVVTGEISGIVIIDFDGEAGCNTLEAMGLDPHVRTGSGGYHVYIQHPGHRVKTLNSKSKRELGDRYPGLDVRADGGYAVFCGRNSVGEYSWLRDMEPDPIDILPQPLRVFLGLEEGEDSEEPEPEQPMARGRGADPPLQDRLLAKYLGEVPRAGRNQAGFDLACQLRDNGFSQAEAESVLREFARYCPPFNAKGLPEPYTDSEALASVRQAYSSPPRQPWTHQEAPKRADTNRPARPEPQGFCDLVPQTSFLQTYLQYGTDMTDAPPEFHLAVGLSVISAMAGNKIYFRAWGEQVYLHLWTLLLAPSGFYRKTTSMKLGLRLLKRHSPDSILANDFTRERLMENLAQQPAGLVPVWEFGALLALMSRDYNAGVKEFLTEIYDSSDYRRETKSGKKIEITQPAVGILAGSTIDWVVDRITAGDLQSGFLARFLYWPVREKLNWRGLGDVSHSALQEQLDSFCVSLSYVSGEAMIPGPVIQQYNTWLRKHETEVNDQELPGEIQGFYTRIGTYVLKFAVIYQLSMTLELEVSSEAMEYAIRLAEYLKSHLIRLMEDEIAIGRDAQDLKRIRGIVASSNSHGMDRRALLKRSKMTAFRLQQLIDTLLQSGELTCEVEKTDGRNRTVYYG